MISRFARSRRSFSLCREREPGSSLSCYFFFPFFSFSCTPLPLRFRLCIPSACEIPNNAVESKLFIVLVIVLSLSLFVDSLYRSGFLPADDILSLPRSLSSTERRAEGEENGTALFSTRKSHVRAGRILSTFSKKKRRRLDGRTDERTSGRADGRMVEKENNGIWGEEGGRRGQGQRVSF